MPSSPAANQSNHPNSSKSSPHSPCKTRYFNNSRNIETKPPTPHSLPPSQVGKPAAAEAQTDQASQHADAQAAITKLAALAHDTRLAIFRLLVRQGGQSLPAGDIAKALDIPANTLSFHLKELSHAQLVTSERQGRYIHYSLHIQGMQHLIHYLTEDCCQGNLDQCQ